MERKRAKVENAKCENHESVECWGCSSVVERSLRMREAPGSNPGISTKPFYLGVGTIDR